MSRTDLADSRSLNGARGIAASAVVVAAVLSVAFVVVIVVRLGDTSYVELSRGYPGIATSMTSALLRLGADSAGGVCFGALVTATFVTPRRSRTMVHHLRDLRIVRWSALVWACCATLLIGVDAADASGQPLSKLLEPGALGYLVQANYIPGAWILVVAAAAVVLVVTAGSTSWVATLLVTALAAVGVLAPVLVTQVLVGPNHDFGSDASIFGVPAAAAWFGSTACLWLRTSRGRRPGATTLRRYRLLGLSCWAVWVATTVIVFAFEMNGAASLVDPTSSLFAVQVIGVSIVAAVTLSRWRKGRSHTSGVPSRRGLTALLSAQICSIALGVAMTRIPPPVYFVPTSTQQSFLGFDLNIPLTPATLFLAGRANLLFLVIAVTASAAYIAAVIRLRRRGDSWPAGRTIGWAAGWTVVVLTTSSGVGPMSAASLAVHMGLHMSLNMLGPLLLVLGGPVTLFLRATRAHRRDEFAGPHEWLATLTQSGLLKSIYNPMYVLAVFVGSYYAIYLTPFYSWAMRLHWAHQGMTLHYLAVGYLFYALVIGVDKPPRPLPHIGKLGLVLAAMPFHAFFGVVVMTSKTILAKKYFDYVDITWLGSLAHDQYVAGGIAWAAGELPLIAVVLALVTQWARQDAQQAKRIDRHADAGLDDSYGDYNRMLQRLSARGTDSGNAVDEPSASSLRVTERPPAETTSRPDLTALETHQEQQ